MSPPGERFAFASEQKAITTLPGFEADASTGRALLEYFTFQNIFTDRTLLEGVELLPAGHYAVLDLGNDRPALERTAIGTSTSASPIRPADDEDYREELDRLFRQAVIAPAGQPTSSSAPI